MRRRSWRFRPKEQERQYLDGVVELWQWRGEGKGSNNNAPRNLEGQRQHGRRVFGDVGGRREEGGG